MLVKNRWIQFSIYTFLSLAFQTAAPLSYAQFKSEPSDQEVFQKMLNLLDEGSRAQLEACEWLGKFNDISIVPALVDAIYFVKVPGEWDWALEKISGRNYGRDWARWMEWLGKQDFEPHSAYSQFKQELLGRIDPNFSLFLKPKFDRAIRLDEIVWGGVRKDGIPSLDDPKMIKAKEASYLNEDEDVFGLSMDGEHHAYPLRILNWHEMLNVTIGGKAVTLTYCTLCGAAVPYEGQIDGNTYTFGSSGLLYRSNKLMYDRQTNSLWSSLHGKPVVGPLVGKNIQLKRHYVVRTTWKEWKEMNPSTLVLDINTGFERDYRPGSVYKEYIKSKDTMFPVAWRDKRLKAKDWVYGLIIRGTAKAYPLKKLKKKSMLQDAFAGENILLLLASKNLTVRAYQRGDRVFRDQIVSGVLTDTEGDEWMISEGGLVRKSDQFRLYRLPGHLSYWFGWYAFFPKTQVWKK